MQHLRTAAIEPLESRRLMSAGVQAYAPDAIVRGEPINQYVADWWTKALQTPVHAADGSVANPMFGDSDTTAYGDTGKVFFLYGTFSGSSTHTAKVPTGTPLFVPVLSIEFSNFDTTTGNVPFDGTNLPGNNTAAALSDMAAQAATPALGPGGSLHLTLDGKSLANPGAYREIAPTFSYVLPADNVDQYFFGLPQLQGVVPTAEADGFYVMLQPLSPGIHTLDFGAVTPGGSLGPLNGDITYTLNVIPRGQFDQSQLAAVNAAAQASSPVGNASLDSSPRKRLFDALD